MRKILSAAIIAIFFYQTSSAQIVTKGILTRSIPTLNEGDTVNVYGWRYNSLSEKEQYYISKELTSRFVNADRIELIDPKFEFWDKVWFDNRGADIKQEGWELDKRQMLYDDAYDYHKNARGNNLIFEDDLLYDYIYQLIFKIFPNTLIKEKVANFGVIILKSHEAQSFTFDNGLMVLTTGLIAQLETEKDLITLLSKNIAHIVLEHNLLNLNQQLNAERKARIWGTIATVASTAAMTYSSIKHDTYHNFDDALNVGLATYFLSSSILESIGADYNHEQLRKANQLSKVYVADHLINFEYQEDEFLANISNAISYAAWQEYHIKNYEYSLVLVNRLYMSRLAAEEDYLLLSKLYRKTVNTTETNMRALEFLKQAKEVSIHELPELNKEAGLIYLRLKDHENAKTAFTDFRRALLDLSKSGVDVNSDLKFVNQILFRYNLQPRPEGNIDLSSAMPIKNKLETKNPPLD